MDYDFLIIGGGIAGISLAAELAPLGSVTVLERESAMGYHASGRSAALYEPRYGKPAVVALSLASGDGLRAAGVLSPRGLLIIGRADQADAFNHDVTTMGFDTISPADALARVPILNPDRVQLAAFNPDAWDIDTDLLLQGMARSARSHGAQILTNAEATAITRTPNGWRIDTPTTSLTARILINAAGAWANTVAALAGVTSPGFTPYRRSMARIPAPAGHDVSGWPMMFGPGEDWYAKPDAGALIVSPAEEDPQTPHDAWADDMVLAEGLARYEDMVTEPVTRLIGSWAGLRTFAPDRVLSIGFAPTDPGFFWLAGQGGYGFQSSIGAARLAADLISGRQPDLAPDIVAALSPARFG
jgi:D-arginine dehydrogenase